MPAPQPSMCPKSPGQFLHHAIAISINNLDARWGDHVVVWYTKIEGNNIYRSWKTELTTGTPIVTPIRKVIWKQKDPYQPKTGGPIGVKILDDRATGTKWPVPDRPVKHWWVDNIEIQKLYGAIRAVIQDNSANPYVYGTAFIGRTMNCSRYAERILKAVGIDYVSAGAIFSTPSELLGGSKGGQTTYEIGNNKEQARWNKEQQRYQPRFYKSTSGAFQPRHTADKRGSYWWSEEDCDAERPPKQKYFERNY